jgi:hypothetical protein
VNQSILVAALAASVLLVGVPKAEACSCLPADIASSYEQASDVFTTKILFDVTIGQTSWYIGRVGFTVKGCLKKGAWVYVKTAASSAACGVTLQKGKTYLLNGAQVDAGFSVPVVSIASCLVQTAVQNLKKADRKFLLGRYNCCGETCACVDGTQPVNCFADPCSVQSCPSGKCTANYCGGCNAEFTDQYGFQVCTPCSGDSDCAWQQSCVNGQCLAGCQTDEDCGTGNWCSPSQSGANSCKPFQQEGDWCGGFTPVWGQAKCAPELICTDVPVFVADASGTCRKPCEVNGDCGESQYCSISGVCRDDGSCYASDEDCGTAGNDYPHIECVGYPVCADAGTCSWNCGTQDTTWYTSCGTPVCFRDDTPPEGVKACPPSVVEGGGCGVVGSMCDAGLGCGAVLVCADSDPKANGCPKSQRAAKTDIKYLDGQALGAMHQQIVDMKLASWRYINEKDGVGPRLGFIIEDNPQSPSVQPNGKRVDLYAFTSMAVAALQVQQQQIATLTAQVETLTGALSAQKPLMSNEICVPE